MSTPNTPTKKNTSTASLSSMNAQFIATLLMCSNPSNIDTSKVDWELFCEKLGYKNVTTAKARWGQIKGDLMRCAKGEVGSTPRTSRPNSTRNTPQKKRKGGRIFDAEDDEENEDSSCHDSRYPKQKQLKKEDYADGEKNRTDNSEAELRAEPKVLLKTEHKTTNVKNETEDEDDDSVFLEKLQY